jgi:hypothetical protein
MAGWTNRLKYNFLNWIFRAQTVPTNFYIALVTSATAPTQDTNTLSQLTEIAAGNGYTTGGYQLAKNATDFDTLTEDDALDKGIIKIKDVTWTASGGNIPASGNGARYAVLTDDNGTVGSREVLGYWSLTSDRTVSSGQNLTLQDLEIDLNES